MIETITELPDLPRRPSEGHKGTFGTVGVVGGCCERESGRTMLGGPVLSGLAALRAGAGLARVALPDRMIDEALASALVLTGVALATDEQGGLIPHVCAPRIDALSSDADSLVVGPGLGVSEGASSIVLRAVGDGREETPVVLDADGLNNLARVSDFARELRTPCVVTPHVGEFRRLADALGIEPDPSSVETRAEAAAVLAQRLGVVVVLKSAATVVSDGLRSWVHEGGDARLATAGTGDVLSGVIGSLIAQHHRAPILAGSRTVSSEQRGGLSLFECACLAVRAHGDASRIWGESRGTPSGGMLASDLLGALPAAMERLRG